MPLIQAESEFDTNVRYFLSTDDLNVGANIVLGSTNDVAIQVTGNGRTVSIDGTVGGLAGGVAFGTDLALVDGGIVTIGAGGHVSQSLNNTLGAGIVLHGQDFLVENAVLSAGASGSFSTTTRGRGRASSIPGSSKALRVASGGQVRRPLKPSRSSIPVSSKAATTPSIRPVPPGSKSSAIPALSWAASICMAGTTFMMAIRAVG